MEGSKNLPVKTTYKVTSGNRFIPKLMNFLKQRNSKDELKHIWQNCNILDRKDYMAFGKYSTE